LSRVIGIKAISLADDCFYKPRFLRVITQHEADLANSRVDAVVYFDKNVLTPKTIGDLFAGDQLSLALNKQDKQLHREFFQTQLAFTPPQAITGLIQCELAEMEFLRRKFPAFDDEIALKNDAPFPANKQLLH